MPQLVARPERCDRCLGRGIDYQENDETAYRCSDCGGTGTAYVIDPDELLAVVAKAMNSVELTQR